MESTQRKPGYIDVASNSNNTAAQESTFDMSSSRDMPRKSELSELSRLGLSNFTASPPPSSDKRPSKRRRTVTEVVLPVSTFVYISVVRLSDHFVSGDLENHTIIRKLLYLAGARLGKTPSSQTITWPNLSWNVTTRLYRICATRRYVLHFRDYHLTFRLCETSSYTLQRYPYTPTFTP